MAWTNDGDEGEGDVKDESAAYLEFLNEEVSNQDLPSSPALLRVTHRPKNSALSMTTTMTS